MTGVVCALLGAAAYVCAAVYCHRWFCRTWERWGRRETPTLWRKNPEKEAADDARFVRPAAVLWPVGALVNLLSFGPDATATFLPGSES